MKVGLMPKNHRPRIAVVGSINMDLVYRVTRLPRPGETLTGTSFQQVHGGKGANQAVAAARMGADVSIIGRVGDDAFGAVLLAGLQRETIDVLHVKSSVGASSGLAMIGVEASGQNCIVVIPGANEFVTPADIASASSIIANADILMLQLEIPVPSVLAALAIARTNSVLTILDPAPAPQNFPCELYDVDVLCPNETEASLITGLPVESVADAEAACRKLRSLGVKLAIITMGAQGCVFCDESGIARHITSTPVSPVDTTAAGDAFAGALGFCLAAGRTVREAAEFACVAGAIASTRHGAQPAMPTFREVADFVAPHSL